MTTSKELPQFERKFDITLNQRSQFESMVRSRAATSSLTEFELQSLVAFLFEKAGYLVQREVKLAQINSHVDMLLYTPSQNGESYEPTAFVEIKQRPKEREMSEGDLRQLYALAATWPEMSAYCITQGEFGQSAYRSVSDWPSIRLVNGARLNRFVDYAGAERLGLHHGKLLKLDDLFVADSLPQVLVGNTTIVTMANNRGGVGKTTMAIAMSEYLAELGETVLVIDLDYQANLTTYFLDGKAAPLNIERFVQGHSSLREVTLSTSRAGISIVPAGAPTFLERLTPLDFVRALHQGLVTESSSTFRWVIIDTSPAMSEVTKSAIAASHYVIAPILPSPYALSGFNHLQQSVVSMQGLMGRGVYLLGCVLTQWTGNDQEAVEKLRAQLTTQDVSLFGPVRRAQSWKIEDTLKTYKSAVKQIVRRIATL